MAIVDDYLRSVLGKNGEELLLVAGQPPQCRAKGTDTSLGGKVVDAAQIEAIIAEIVPPKRMQGAAFRFQYSSSLGAFIGIGQRGEGTIQVLLRKASLGEPSFGPGTAAPAAAPAPAPAPAPRSAAPSPPPPTASFPDEELSALPMEAAPVAPPPPPPPPPPAAPAARPAATGLAPAASFTGIPQVTVAPLAAGQAPPIDKLFGKMVRAKASDLHLSSTVQPMIRVDGSMMTIKDEGVLSPEMLYKLVIPIMPARNRAEFEARHDTDFAYEIQGLGRFRCNVFSDRKGPGAVFRIIPSKILTCDDLKLPEVVKMFANLSKGLVLVTGPTGSGKSTTLAAIVDLVNATREDHLITIEDPIEFVHQNKKCLVNQREVHTHTESFKSALRAALREDPDICLVGEMRDLETIEIAMETAETGHLVFGTLHTTTAASTVNRIIEQFPADRQDQIRVMLSESLRGVVSQTLLKRIGGGRIACLEVLLVTGAVANLIREGKTFQIPSVQQTSKGEGMSLQHEVLAEMVKSHIVDPKEAYIKAVDKKGFLGALENMKFNIQPLMASLAGTIDL